MQYLLLSFLIASSLLASTKQEWLEKGKVEIEKGNFKSAREYLEKALSQDSKYVDAILELGILSMKEKKYNEAFEDFRKVQHLSPCQKKNLQELSTLGEIWRKNQFDLTKEINIYEILTKCRTDNPDDFYYYGRALYHGSQLSAAEIALQKCLALAPDYHDAAILLGYIDYREGKLEEAKAVFEKYPHHPDAKEGLALIEGKKKGAQEGRLQKARMYHEEGNYSLALEEYTYLAEEGNAEDFWPALFDVKSHTSRGFLLTSNYTEAKENDPSLGVPVVKDYYFLNTATLRFPIRDAWRLDAKQIYFHQRENDIYPPKQVNYSAYSLGGEATARYFFYKHFRWDLSLRALRMWGKQNMVAYPFKNTTRFEPGTTLFYNDGTQFFYVNGHRESYIFKDFSVFQAKLLATDYFSGGYGFQFNPWILIKLQLDGSYIRIRDYLKNKKDQEAVMFTMGFPFDTLRKYVFGIYRFEHSHYEQLNPNYYSYDQQYRHTLGAKIFIPFTRDIYWETLFEHRWQTTNKLFQPIGNFLLVQLTQYLAANRVTSRFGARYHDFLDFFIEGHYFRDTLPYRDWNLNGALLLQF